MCGIAAIFTYRDRGPRVEQQELLALRDQMRARGPDGAGSWLSEDRRVGLAHRRLAVIDLSEGGAQPMVEPKGRIVVTYNGEIYNYRELREQLERQGKVFRSESDTEVLLHMYEAHGPAMVQRLRGMFAFALWDGTRRKLLLARDPYGIKPLYYADDGVSIRVASQVQALLAGKTSKGIDLAGKVGFLLFGSVPEPYTTRSQIRSLPAGSWAWVDERGLQEPVRYFSIARTFRQAHLQQRTSSAEQLHETVRDALLDSVRAHLVADVPVGAFLSAGIDSGALVGLARDAGAVDLQTLTLGFDEFEGTPYDEAPLAAATARRFETEHRCLQVRQTDFAAEWPRILAAMDQPSIDGVNTYMVSKAAAEAGLKVVISGLGGDELFGGYPSFRTVPMWARRLRWATRLPGLGEVSLRLASGMLRHQRRISPKLAGMVRYGGTVAGSYLLKRGLFMPWELPDLIGRDQAEEGLRQLAPLGHIEDQLCPDPGSDYARVATLEATLYMRTQLLRDSDWASMAHGLELRPPLVDAHLLERLAPMLVSQPTGTSKSWLAQAPGKALPHDVIHRPKSGFTVPMAHWIHEQLTGDAPLRHRYPRSAGAHWSRRQALRLLESEHFGA